MLFAVKEVSDYYIIIVAPMRGVPIVQREKNGIATKMLYRFFISDKIKNNKKLLTQITKSCINNTPRVQMVA